MRTNLNFPLIKRKVIHWSCYTNSGIGREACHYLRVNCPLHSIQYKFTSSADGNVQKSIIITNFENGGQEMALQGSDNSFLSTDAAVKLR